MEPGGREVLMVERECFLLTMLHLSTHSWSVAVNIFDSFFTVLCLCVFIFSQFFASFKSVLETFKKCGSFALLTL